MSLSSEMRDRAAQCLEGMNQHDIRVLCECCLDHLDSFEDVQHFIDYVILTKADMTKSIKWDGLKHADLGRKPKKKTEKT